MLPSFLRPVPLLALWLLHLRIGTLQIITSRMCFSLSARSVACSLVAMVSIPDVSAQGRIAGRLIEVPRSFVLRPAAVSAPTSALACGDFTPLVSQLMIGITFSAERWLACLVFVLAVAILFARAGHNNFIPVTVPYPTCSSLVTYSFVYIATGWALASSSSSCMARSRETVSFGVESNPHISHGIGLMFPFPPYFHFGHSLVSLLGVALCFHALLVTLASVLGSRVCIIVVLLWLLCTSYSILHLTPSLWDFVPLGIRVMSSSSFECNPHSVMGILSLAMICTLLLSSPRY
jgi:hypothetical protein